MGRKSKLQIKKEARKNQLVVSLISLCLILILVMGIGRFGIVGEFTSNVFGYIFGEHYVIFIFILVTLIGVFLLGQQKKKYFKKFIWGVSLLFIALNIYFSISYGELAQGNFLFTEYITDTFKIFNGDASFNAGLLGSLLYDIFVVSFDVTGTYIIIAVLTIIGALLIVDVNIFKMMLNSFKENLFYEEEPVEKKNEVRTPSLFEFEKVKDVKRKKKSKISIDHTLETQEKDYQQRIKPISLTNSGNKELIEYHLPSIGLLDEPVFDRSNENAIAGKKKSELLINLLSQFDIPVSLVDIHIGPSVTKFEIKPEAGIKVSKISALTDDIKMGLAARDIRIEAPIPGHATVGIEVPNVKTTPVCMKQVLVGIPSDARKLTMTLGKDLQGNSIFMDLDKMPHLLVAGATGSGKSVGINSFIMSLILRTTPEEVKLLLIDPKKVEFTPYAKIPHLLTNVITDAGEASKALKVVVEKMDLRYNLFRDFGVKNITAYNQLQRESKNDKMPPLPFIVVIIDELADLMMVAGKEVEGSIQRITQLARAAGIHLIVATQRPSTDVITGIIKANIPSRIAFAVSSGIDSRTILDTVGAERLLGNGDMLYYPSGQSSPVRLQGVYVSDKEINEVCKFVSDQCTADFDPDFFNLTAEYSDNSSESSTYDDPLYQEAKEYVISAGRASTSLLQRRFRIGYNRAARLIDILESKGIIGPAVGSKPRQVYGTLDEE